MNRLPQIVLSAAVLVLIVGVGLAVFQPGSLGDDDETATVDDDTTDDGSGSEETTTTSPDDPVVTDTTGNAGTDTTDPDDSQTTATTSTSSPTTGPTADEGPTTSRPGSGLGSSGQSESADTADGLAATGGESLMLAGIALAGAGVVARRRAARPVGPRLR